MGNLLVSLGTTAGLALVASSERCVLSVIGVANQSLLLKEWSIWFDGQLSSGQPAAVCLCRCTTLGNMTAASAFGQVVRHGSTALTSVMIGRQVDFSNTSSEPTSSGILARRYVHPQVGYHEKFPYGEEIMLNGAVSLGIFVTAPASANCRAEMVWEE